jgi:hypothetical protein
MEELWVAIPELQPISFGSLLPLQLLLLQQGMQFFFEWAFWYRELHMLLLLKMMKLLFYFFESSPPLC